MSARRAIGAVAGLVLAVGGVALPLSIAAAGEPDGSADGVTVSVAITPLACPFPPGTPGTPGRPPHVAPGPPSDPCHPGNPGGPGNPGNGHGNGNGKGNGNGATPTPSVTPTPTATAKPGKPGNGNPGSGQPGKPGKPAGAASMDRAPDAVGWVIAGGVAIAAVAAGLVAWLVPGAAATVFPGLGGASAASAGTGPYDVLSKKAR